MLAGLRVKNAILDGEIVALDKFGRSQFMPLMRRKTRDVAFYAFDIMWLDGAELRSLPLIERKRVLRQVVHGREGILYAAHIQRRGVGLFEAVCQKDCEGIVAKHRDAPYGRPLPQHRNAFTCSRITQGKPCWLCFRGAVHPSCSPYVFTVSTRATFMTWWYKIRDASGKLMEIRRGFHNPKEAQDAGERAARTIQDISPGKMLKVITGKDESQAE